MVGIYTKFQIIATLEVYIYSVTVAGFQVYPAATDNFRHYYTLLAAKNAQFNDWYRISSYNQLPTTIQIV